MSGGPRGGPGARLAGEVFAVLQLRTWGRLDAVIDPSVEVEVHAAPGVRTTRNAHLWRSRSLRGREQLLEYLGELHQAVPALVLEPRGLARRQDHEVVRADCAGVDSAGSPFDAVADFSVWERDGRLSRLHVQVAELAVGTEVTRHTEGDPRRYFKAFLGRGAA